MMNRIVTGFLLVFLPIASLRAQANGEEKLFDEANRLYLEQKYDSAAAKYESVLAAGYESGELYYNLGNACYKLGRIQNAILNYERAKRLMPRDEDVEHNLRLANLQVQDKVDSVPELFVYRWINELTAMVTLKTMAWTAYGIFLVTLLALSLFFFGRNLRVRRYSFLAAGAGLVLLVAVVTGCFLESYRQENVRYGIVMTDVANIKAAPDSSGNDLFIIHRGLKVQMLDLVNNWYKIRLADGKTGWAKEHDIEAI